MKKVIKHYTESIHYDIEQTAKVIKLVAAQLFNKLNFDVVPEEYSALDVISCHSGICQRDLAKLIFKDRANTGRILNSLEAKGLITRFVATKNNRLVRKMAITEAGYKKLNQINVRFEKSLFENREDLFSEEDVENLQVGLKKFRTSLERLLELKI